MTHKSYYNNSRVNQAVRAFNRIQNANRIPNTVSGQIAWTELHFKGNVPKITEEPRYTQFGLPENVEELIEAEREKEKEQRNQKDTEKRNRFKIGAIVVLVILFYIFYQKSDDVIMPLFGMLGPAALAHVVYISVFDVHREYKRTPLVKYEKEYNEYKDALSAYNYWKNIKSVKFWDKLDGHAFERKVADLYRKIGYEAVVSKAGGDGGIDIVLTKESEKIAVQCKAHNKAVAPAVARDLYGTMMSSGFKKGMIVSKNGFTKGVYDFVKGKDIELVDLDDILQIVSCL